ncbi:hypothetical protein L873DRAFT_1804796 [Choiromyces venosus 120613-1]|uniref:Uncharacterized protein n=1 Tax=Choiromyces venosus 120613-1 TaxID=1336337 RepID=A0A3N4JQV0_9PEZI|nr:hypothetical protein L873DRAFT_1804796 [Choiromyces venosus 120613-1]
MVSPRHAIIRNIFPQTFPYCTRPPVDLRFIPHHQNYICPTLPAKVLPYIPVITHTLPMLSQSKNQDLPDKTCTSSRHAEPEHLSPNLVWALRCAQIICRTDF